MNRASSNVDLVLSIYAAWESGDYDATEWAHADIEWVRADGPDPGTWTGASGLASAWQDFLSAWEGYRIEIESCRELDGGRVLVLTRRLGRGRTSGLEIETDAAKGATLWELRDGKVAKQITYWDRRRAISEIGLDPEASL